MNVNFCEVAHSSIIIEMNVYRNNLADANKKEFS